MQPVPQRKKFLTSQDWNNFLQEVQKNGGGIINGDDLLAIRSQCYLEVETKRGRPLLVYASKFINGSNPGAPININLSDIDGFADLTSSIKDSDSIDVLIHSPGGSPDATERLVYLLRGRFKEVHFLVPHSAYSAATMLCLSGDSITMHPNATLGPIDPQINGVPAGSIKRSFTNIQEKLKTDGASALPAYLPLIEKYTLHLLEICDDSERLSKELVCEWIKKYMSKGGHDDTEIDEIVKYFSDYDLHKLHSRPLVFEKIRDMRLNISVADDVLSELLWESYILLEGFFQITPFVKLFENRYGISWGRNHTVSPQPIGPVPQRNELSSNDNFSF